MCSRVDSGASQMVGRKDKRVAQKDLRRVAAEAAKVERAQQALREAILAAIASGESYRDIAPYAGLSYSRIYQIAQEARREQPPG